MSNYQQIINRFLTAIYLKDSLRGTTSVLAQRETQGGLKPFLENLVEDNFINNEDDLAKFFLHFLLKSTNIYHLLWRNQAKYF